MKPILSLWSLLAARRAVGDRAAKQRTLRVNWNACSWSAGRSRAGDPLEASKAAWGGGVAATGTPGTAAAGRRRDESAQVAAWRLQRHSPSRPASWHRRSACGAVARNSTQFGFSWVLELLTGVGLRQHASSRPRMGRQTAGGKFRQMRKVDSAWSSQLQPRRRVVQAVPGGVKAMAFWRLARWNYQPVGGHILR